MSDPSPPASSSLLKPVYPGYLADPFAWKHEGTWYMIGTAEPGGQIKDGRYFPSLVSRDFKTWEYAGHVLNRPDPSLGSDYWAPEVAYSDGIFYMYYSIGSGDQAHTLRVATSDKPLGPYEDTGVALTDLAQCRFAIDPDPFRDVDGNWYLFYARDFLDTDGGIRAGTALVVDRLTDMLHLAGEERAVLRARYDWQRWMADRPMPVYGDDVFDWHTLEGACVVRRGDKYVCLYSGGRWDSELYGVDYGVADSVLGPYTEDAGPIHARITQTRLGRIIGPGHNSVVVGPDDETTYIVYHGWNEARTIRSPYVSRLDWDGWRPLPVNFSS